MCEQKQFENCKLYKDTLYYYIKSYTSAYLFYIPHCRNKRCQKDGEKGKKILEMDLRQRNGKKSKGR